MSLADDVADYARIRRTLGNPQGHWVDAHYEMVNGTRYFVTGHWSLNPERSTAFESDAWQRDESAMRLRQRLKALRDG